MSGLIGPNRTTSLVLVELLACPLMHAFGRYGHSHPHRRPPEPKR